MCNYNYDHYNYINIYTLYNYMYVVDSNIRDSIYYIFEVSLCTIMRYSMCLYEIQHVSVSV